MKHRMNIVRGIALLLALLLVAGCTAPAPNAEACPTNQPASCPTTEVLACPTAEELSCPSEVVQPLPSMNEWRSGYSQGANVVITFDPGEKCFMDIIKPPDSPAIMYEVVVNDQAHENYTVAIVTLDEGKTIQDLEEYHQANPIDRGVPDFAQLQVLQIVAPMSATVQGIPPMPEGPVYFVCFVQGPDENRVIDEFGPVQIPPNQ